MTEDEIEDKIVSVLIDDLLAAEPQLWLGVNDGEEVTVSYSRDKAKLIAALRSTDEDYLLVWKESSGAAFGWIRLIWGNGCDLISDNTTNLDDAGLLAHAESVAEELSQ